MIGGIEVGPIVFWMSTRGGGDDSGSNHNFANDRCAFGDLLVSTRYLSQSER
jgi:hypothetical protein